MLGNFAEYPQWNPFIRSASGELHENARLHLVMGAVGAKPMTIRPRVSRLINGKELRWKGRLVLPGLMDVEHMFRLEEMSSESTRFIHSESFSGILIPFMKRQLQGPIRESFIAMNEALKRRAETAQ